MNDQVQEPTGKTTGSAKDEYVPGTSSPTKKSTYGVNDCASTTTPADVDNKSDFASGPVSQSQLDGKYLNSYHLTPHATGTHVDRFEMNLLATSGAETEVLIYHGNGKSTVIKTGDQNLSATEQKAIDKATTAKAYEQWANNATSGVAGGALSANYGMAEFNKHNDLTENLLGVANDQMYQLGKNAESTQAYSQTVQDAKAALSSKIGQMLADSNLGLADDETLNLQVDLNGRITIGEGIADKEKAEAIENVLNEDSDLGMELLLNHAQEGYAASLSSGDSFDTDATYSRIMAAVALKNETGLGLSDIDFDAATISFSDQTGNHDIDSTLARDYTVMQGLFNSFSWNGESYEKAEPLSVSFAIAV